jgi:hypothetical protein
MVADITVEFKVEGARCSDPEHAEAQSSAPGRTSPTGQINQFKELAAFLLEEHVAADLAKAPTEACTTCCPKCGQPGKPAPQKAGKRGAGLPERTVRTRAGDIDIQRERWKCERCRIVFFSARRSPEVGHGRV